MSFWTRLIAYGRLSFGRKDFCRHVRHVIDLYEVKVRGGDGRRVGDISTPSDVGVGLFPSVDSVCCRLRYLIIT